MTHTRVAMWAFGAGLLAAAAIALGTGLAAVPASAVDEAPRCDERSLSSSSDRKCPSPSPTSGSGQQGSEVGCRDLIAGAGQFRGVGAAPSAGAALEFVTTYASATCSEVTYTVIARDMDTYSELGRHVQSGNDRTELLASVIALPGYAKDCLAVDVIVSEGNVVHDIAPNSRDLAETPYADLCRQGVSEMAWN